MAEQEMKDGVISFEGYRLFKMNYKCDPTYNPKTIPDGKYSYNFTYGAVDLPGGNVQINLLVVAFFGNDQNDSDNAPFSITVEIGGKFATKDEKWDHRWDANAIAILYPYVRAVVSTITAQAGIDTIVLPTVNVAAMLLNNSDKGTEDK